MTKEKVTREGAGGVGLKIQRQKNQENRTDTGWGGKENVQREGRRDRKR